MTSRQMILRGRLLTDGREWPMRRVVVEEGRIVAVEADAGRAEVDVDAGDGWLAPGFVDLQVNGAGGIDIASADDPAGAVASVARTLVRHGVTSFCPTIVSSPEDVILSRLPALAPRAVAEGAESLGGHVEGPFISERYRGVHDPTAIRPPSLAEIERWLAVSRPRIVTLAPEIDGATAAIDRLRTAGVVVSLGHSGADAPTASTALAAGARMGTHLFNAMPPMLHRAPGLVGALLASDAVVGMIVDGAHVDRLVVQVVVRAIGVARVALVSDAVAAAGAPPGRYVLGGQVVESDGRVVRRADGTLAGSAATLDACVRCARDWLPWLSPAEVIRMATQTPAEALGGEVVARKGRIATGYDADLVVLDRDWRISATIVRGGLVRSAGNLSSHV